MKTLIFNGSARKNGTTESMKNVILDSLSGEVKSIRAYDWSVSPCLDCRYCMKHRACAVKDDMQKIYHDIDEADNIIFISPIYFHCLPAPLKTLVDRCQIYWSSHVRKDRLEKPVKKGAIVLNAGAPAFEHQFTAAELVLKGLFYDMQLELLDIITMANADRRVFTEETELITQLQKLSQRFILG